jgi:hypothetical protein
MLARQVTSEREEPYVTGRPLYRFTPLLGAVFVVVTVIGFVVAGDTPDVDANPTTIRADFDDEAAHQIGAYLVALGAVALLFFSGHWRGILRTLNPAGRMADVALVGASVASAGFLVAALIHGALTDAAQKETVTDPALQALNALDNWSFYPFSIGVAVFVLASGVALVGGRAFFPAWVGWAAVVIGVLQLVPLVGFFAFLAAAVWVFVVSLMLFGRWDAVRGLGGEPPPPPAGAPAM